MGDLGRQGSENETIYIQEISRSKTITQTCIVKASQHSHTFDAQMACVNCLVPPPALPLLLSAVILLSLSLPLSSLMSHILPSSHHAACHSTDFSHSAGSKAPRHRNPSRLNLINEALRNWQEGWEHHGWVNVSWKLRFIKTVRFFCDLEVSQKTASDGIVYGRDKFMPDDPLLSKWLTEHWTETSPVRSSVGLRITSNQTDSDTKSDWGQRHWIQSWPHINSQEILDQEK